MSRNIKSLKKLHSLIGGTVQVVDSEGHKFNAVVEKCSIPGNPNEYAVDLVTADSRADDDPYWWSKSVSEKTWGHHVVRPHQLTEELRSVTTFKEKAEILDKVRKSKKAKRKKVKEENLTESSSKESFLTREQLLEHIGNRCKMSDGTEGLIVKTDRGTPRILMNTRANDNGWLYDERVEDDTGASVEVRSQYKYAWNVIDNDDAEDISVVEILEDDVEEATESSKTILDMTIREVLEKLDEIIKR